MSTADERLVAAGRTGNLALARTALEEGANINAVDGSGQTALHWASKQANPAIVELLLSTSRVNPNAQSSITGDTPLHLSEDVLVTKKLIAKGANISVRNKQGLIPEKCVEDGDTVKVLKQAAMAKAFSGLAVAHEDDEGDSSSDE